MRIKTIGNFVAIAFCRNDKYAKLYPTNPPRIDEAPVRIIDPLYNLFTRKIENLASNFLEISHSTT